MDRAQITTFVSRTFQAIRRDDRRSILSAAMDRWSYDVSLHPPDKFLSDIFPETASQAITLGTDVSHWFELPYGERLVLATLLQTLKPAAIFEFGTFTGATTCLMADMAPRESIVHTIDLPDEELLALCKGVDPAMIGMRFHGHAAYAGKIVSHRSNSRHFDYGAFQRNVPFVYVDASHAYEDVVHDSRQALKMVSHGGLIVWDDYAPNCEGVVRAIQDLGIEITRIRHTRLALHQA